MRKKNKCDCSCPKCGSVHNSGSCTCGCRTYTDISYGYNVNKPYTKVDKSEGDVNSKVEPLWCSNNCECHYIEPYGFVPEMDCPEHDTPTFIDFVKFLKVQQRQEVIEEVKSEIISLSKNKHSRNEYEIGYLEGLIAVKTLLSKLQKEE